MSTQLSRPVVCPHCGQNVQTELWPGINAEVNPNLREQVLKESLFDWTCPQCGYQAQVAYPCLYHDKGRKFMVYLVPGGCLENLHATQQEQELPQLDCVQKRAVSSLAELKEKILIFEANLDDCAVELTKLALCGVLEKKSGQAISAAYFTHADKTKNRIGFACFFAGQQEPVARVTLFDAYRKSQEIARRYQPLCREFASVDAVLAQTMLDEYLA